ncbi:MAG: C25 family cysteine peptidase [Candidatus Edwardsbacteria bacterium]|nr:C25 family cysteine peptidase [Candidatus Edwardsbacteria bacterium]
MATRRLFFTAAVGLCLTGLIADQAFGNPGQCRTPSSAYAYCPEVCQWDIDKRDEDNVALGHQGYTVSDPANVIPSGTATNILLPTYIGEMQSWVGAYVHIGHADAIGISLEVYAHTPTGLQTVNNRITALSGQYSGLAPAEAENLSSYAVAMDWLDFAGYASFSNAIVDLETCYSSACPGLNGARVMFVNEGELNHGQPNQILQNMLAIWNGFDGGWGAAYRWAAGACEHGSAKLNMVEVAADGGRTTLAPYLKSSSLKQGGQVPTAGIYVTLKFDTFMDTSVWPTSALSVQGSTFRISEARWDTDTTLVVLLTGNEGLYGPSDLVASSDNLHSADNSNFRLDGDGRNGPSDWEIFFQHGQDPAADVTGFVVNERGVASWIVESEWQTQQYRIDGLAGLDNWTALTTVPAGSGHRGITVPAGYQRYRLIEVEMSGREIMHETAVSGPRPIVDALAEPTAEEMRVRLRDRAKEREALPPPELLVEGNRLAIVVSPPFVYDAFWLASYWEWRGVDVEVYSTTIFGTDPANIKAGIKWIVASDPSTYFLLIGDGIDPEWPGPGQSWTVNGWPTIRNTYLAEGYPPEGNPSHGLIPTEIVLDAEPRNQNMAWFQPYWFLSDNILYGDTDGDGLSDKVVGRLAFIEVDDLLNYIMKVSVYNDTGCSSPGPLNTTLFVGDVDHYETGEGALAQSVADDVVAALPWGTSAYQLKESLYPGITGRNNAAVARWNGNLELAVFVSSMGNRYKPGNFLVKPYFTTDMISPDTWCPWVLAATCGTGDEFRTMNPSMNESVGHDLVSAASRGAIGWVGPTSGTWQDGNREMALAILNRISEDSYRPVSRSVQLAQRDVITWARQNNREDVENTARSYAVYGDALTPLRHINIPVAAPETEAPKLFLGANHPNPFNPQTTIEFSLSRRGPVMLTVYDAGGRLVRTLVSGSLEPGRHSVAWNGADTYGRSVASGIYFARLWAEDQALVRKLGLVK